MGRDSACADAVSGATLNGISLAKYISVVNTSTSSSSPSSSSRLRIGGLQLDYWSALNSRLCITLRPPCNSLAKLCGSKSAAGTSYCLVSYENKAGDAARAVTMGRVAVVVVAAVAEAVGGEVEVAGVEVGEEAVEGRVEVAAEAVGEVAEAVDSCWRRHGGFGGETRGSVVRRRRAPPGASTAALPAAIVAAAVFGLAAAAPANRTSLEDGTTVAAPAVVMKVVAAAARRYVATHCVTGWMETGSGGGEAADGGADGNGGSGPGMTIVRGARGGEDRVELTEKQTLICLVIG
ncbi:hypothetical protein VOLCADRAFT_97489 [Volvox carteri f. nagariensis]|uniref:Pherophorin domain-containing protein n=1 Tax=Volvox carteri f. nagariensis TaxID=3068 RepID=D8UCV8_VOLCA|nr:uncharacterized protein VOLCADRAFT_97489 [Volvox carteri f. nagariensis]EFJ42457.1 hypothetical protein VOLCADRAFT_97489 [Volvox carteri f. nagariensis]|eukprot:XP_002956520.1 hypothetical protein VOLCADRAFT_97489 [Volvox carteri f. nagariensis]